jgi:hypothetical protein
MSPPTKSTTRIVLSTTSFNTVWWIILTSVTLSKCTTKDGATVYRFFWLICSTNSTQLPYRYGSTLPISHPRTLPHVVRCCDRGRLLAVCTLIMSWVLTLPSELLREASSLGGLGIRMLTLDTKTSLYSEDRGRQVPMVLELDYIPYAYKPHTHHIHTKLSVPRPSFRTFHLLDLTTLI